MIRDSQHSATADADGEGIHRPANHVTLDHGVEFKLAAGAEAPGRKWPVASDGNLHTVLSGERVGECSVAPGFRSTRSDAESSIA